MKAISRHITIVFFVLIFLTACDSSEHLDGTAMDFPYAVIYKTRNDYFNYVNYWGLQRSAAAINFTIENGDTLYQGRWKLSNDYIMAVEATANDYYTNITFGEFIGYKDKNTGIPYFSKDSILKRVIDKDPYLEFWVPLVAGTFQMPHSSLVPIINEYIENGELEKYFKRLK